MRKTIPVKNVVLMLVVIISFNSCTKPDPVKKYLRKVLENLEKIESATYQEKSEGWVPGDTSANGIYYKYIKEYNNPADTTIGASFVSLLQEDTTQMTFCYDGKMRAVVYEEDKKIVVDSFNIRKLPFRPLSPPFFNYVKNIIKYVIGTNDSISVKTEDLGKSVYLCLTIFEDRQVEFFGKAHYMEKTPYDFGETTSKYEIWVNKSDNLPFKIRRELSHDISVRTVSGVELNKINIRDFKATDYFQPDFRIQPYKLGSGGPRTSNLIGQAAPAWQLEDIDGNIHALNDQKSKVVLIQFTSVSCGPCRASIPFLNGLRPEYKIGELDFVAIECTSQSLGAMKNYTTKNKINYSFLKATKEAMAAYQVNSFPVFFILDKNRVIRKVINGYGEGTTDEEIKNAINEMI